MIIFNPVILSCQDPEDKNFIERSFSAIRCTIRRDTPDYERYKEEAERLAGLTNAAAANETAYTRDETRKLIDAFTGVLTENAWVNYINQRFPSNGPVASLTDYEDAGNQIDIILNTEKLIEVRSSYVRNGARFGICHDVYSFKNIGPYSNSVKSGETQKDYYCGALLTSDKNNLLELEEIEFYLVGSSTLQMMNEIGYYTDLKEQDAFSIQPGSYRVIQYKNSLDVEEFIELLRQQEGFIV